MTPILIVDDDPAAAEMYGEAFRIAGYRVDVATNGMDALNRCVSCRYALVISDVNMPGIDGVDLMEMIRAQRPGMPFVYITGGDMTPAAIKIWKADALVKKQDGIAALQRKVREIIFNKGTDAGTSQSQEAVPKNPN